MTKANFAPTSPRTSNSVNSDGPDGAAHGPMPASFSDDDADNNSGSEGDNGGGTSTNNGTGSAG